MSKNKEEQYKHQLNQVVESHKKVFVRKPIFLHRVLDKGTNTVQIYCTDEQIYLKSEFGDNINPYIEFMEKWKDDTLFEYSYRFVIPFFNFAYALDGSSSPTRLNNFQFRYEVHPEKNYNKPHLHFFDSGWSPHYPTHEIKFPEFFEIIKREFIDSDMIKFSY